MTQQGFSSRWMPRAQESPVRPRPAWVNLLYPLILVLPVIVCVLIPYLLWNNSENGGTFTMKTTLADLDRDGDLDVILHSRRNESEFTAFAGPTLWFNQGGGQFTPQVPYLGGWSSAPGDVDGDGDPDLAIFSGNILQWALNQGGAQGGQRGELKMNNASIAPVNVMQFGTLLSGDLNSDGQVDAVALGCCGRAYPDNAGVYPPNHAWIWMNRWNDMGRVNPETAAIHPLDGLPVGGAALGDLDSDGDLDLLAGILASKVDPSLSRAARVLLNDGAGNFTDSGQRLGESESFAVALGDLDGDGDLDAVLGKERGAEAWINQGHQGEFAISAQKFSREKTTAAFLSDLDRDGDLDAILAGAQIATTWWNDGHAGFNRSDFVLRFSDRQALAVADFTSDGYPDIFIGDGSSVYHFWVNLGNGIFRQER